MASEHDWQSRVGRLLLTLCFVTLSGSAVVGSVVSYVHAEPLLDVVLYTALAVYTVAVSALCLRAMWTD